jgi:phospholipase C
LQIVKHVFVLVLENRAFDHLLGFSGITGSDAQNGQATRINGLTGNESNSVGGTMFGVTQPADFVMPADPGHEFPDVLQQLCGQGATYAKGGNYPPVTNAGFAAVYAGEGNDPREIMKCFSPSQLPVLVALAGEFALCDNWHASLPSSTWPNRFFVHAASSGGLDHQPSTTEILQWETVDGFKFPNGTIFDALNAKGVEWRIYGGDSFPLVAALHDINLTQIHHYDDFAGDVGGANYAPAYTFIEPKYDPLNNYEDGDSQHPLNDVTRGENLIKLTYEAIRNSPVWNSSLLIVTWDEHGGFYDHAPPPPAVAPGDTDWTNANNTSGFTFEQYGPRVCAVAVSPLIPRNRIDHRLYDHASIPRTLEACFGLRTLTQRDTVANSLTALISLRLPRGDAPAKLPNLAISGAAPAPAAGGGPTATPIPRPLDSADEDLLPGVLQAALHYELALSPPDQKGTILTRFGAIKTRADAEDYLNAVEMKMSEAPKA